MLKKPVSERPPTALCSLVTKKHEASFFSFSIFLVFFNSEVKQAVQKKSDKFEKEDMVGQILGTDDQYQDFYHNQHPR